MTWPHSTRVADPQSRCCWALHWRPSQHISPSWPDFPSRKCWNSLTRETDSTGTTCPLHWLRAAKPWQVYFSLGNGSLICVFLVWLWLTCNLEAGYLRGPHSVPGPSEIFAENHYCRKWNINIVSNSNKNFTRFWNRLTKKLFLESWYLLINPPHCSIWFRIFEFWKYHLANLDSFELQLLLMDLIKSPLFITLFPNSEKFL